MEQVR